MTSRVETRLSFTQFYPLTERDGKFSDDKVSVVKHGLNPYLNLYSSTRPFTFCRYSPRMDT